MSKPKKPFKSKHGSAALARKDYSKEEGSNLIVLPDKYYLRKALPAHLLCVAISLLQKSGEFKVNPSMLKNLNAEVVNVFMGIPDSEHKRIALLLDKDCNTVIRQTGAKNELGRVLALSELVVSFKDAGKLSDDATSYHAAHGILEEANSLDPHDWGGASEVKASVASAKLQIAKLGYF